MRRIILVLITVLAVSFGGGVRVSSDDTATAEMAFEAKKYQEAKALYRDAYINSTAGADVSAALFGIAKSDYYLKNYYEAGINLKRFLKSYPNSPLASEAHFLWGMSLMQIHRYSEAEEQFNKIRGVMDDKAKIGLAEIAVLKGQDAVGEKILLSIDPKVLDSNYRVLYLRAMMASKAGRHNEAIQLINKIPDLALVDEGISVSKAVILYNARKYIESKDLLTAIVRAPASRIEAVQAKRTLLQINEIENNSEEVLKLALDLINFESTDELKQKVIAIYDKKADYDSMFRYLTGLRDKRIMSEEMEKRLKKLADEKNPKIDEYLGKYYFYLHQDSHYNIDLAKYMIAKGSTDIAKRLLQRASKGKFGSEATITLAEMLFKEKAYNEAKRLARPITTDATYAGQASLLMAQLLEREGNHVEAASYRFKAIRILEIQKDYYRIAEIQLRAGNTGDALKNYVRAADKGELNAIIKAADLYYASGKREISKTYYKKALDKGIVDPKLQQWVSYQYGKLAPSDEYLEKAKSGGGVVAETVEMLKN